MKKKKLFLVSSVSLAAIGITISMCYVKSQKKFAFQNVKAEQIDLVTRLCGGVTTDNVRTFVKDDYEFNFEFQNVTFGADYVAIGVDGYLRSVTSLNGLSSITFDTTYNNLAVSAGYLTSNGVERYYYFGADYDSTKLSDQYVFDGRSVTHLSLNNLSGDTSVIISAMSIDYSCEGSKESQTIESLGAGYENYTWDFKGAGSESTPFLIENVSDWTKLSVTYADKTFLGLYFKLTSNLGDTVNPITTSVANFKGIFDGDEHTIYENFVSNSEVNLGLFSKVTGAGSISDLTVEGNVNYNGTANASVGGFVGYAETTGDFTNCINRATVHGYTSKWTAAESGTGGIVGRVFKASITDCENYGSISSDGKSDQAMTGGIVGTVYEGNSPENTTTIERCSNFGNIDLATKYMAGGIVGLANRTTIVIQDCVNGSDSVHPLIKGARYIGGIAGIVYNNIVLDGSYIDGCQNYGEVRSSLTAKACVGGIAGTCHVKITNCTNRYIVASGNGNPTSLSKDSSYAGWIVGDPNDDGTTITGSTNEYVAA